MHALLGNTAAVDRRKNDQEILVRYPAPGNRITEVRFPPDYTLADAFLVITKVGGGDPDKPGASQSGVWSAHSDADAPDWVESDSPGLATLLSEHYGCPIGRHADWETTVVDATSEQVVAADRALAERIAAREAAEGSK